MSSSASAKPSTNDPRQRAEIAGRAAQTLKAAAVREIVQATEAGKKYQARSGDV